MNRINDVRLAIALVLLLAAGFVGHGVHASSADAADVAERQGAAKPGSLTGVPLQLAAWRGAEAAPLDAETAAAVGADRILNRTYTGGPRPVGLYVAAYDRQRPSISIHSPLHCLPGTGWSVLSDDTHPVALPAHNGALRRLVAVRGRDRIVILYWYAIHGRMLASDALSRVYLLADSVRLGRNDAALVRLVVPVVDEDDDDAERVGLQFVEALAPSLERVL